MMMPMLRGFDVLDNFFDDPFFYPERKGTKFNEVMKTDIKEKDGNYMMDIEMPGVNKEDISIDLSDGYLTVSAETKNETDNSDETNGYIHKERYEGKISRSYYVGKDLNEDDIKAQFKNGMLSLVFPKENKKIEEKKSIKIQ